MTSSDPLLLGIDVGTSRIKAALFDVHGRMASLATRPTPSRSLAPGCAEIITNDLLRLTCEVVRELSDRCEAPQRIRALAVASFGESGVLVDHQIKSQQSIAVWFDRRPQSALDAFLREFGTERLAGITGLCPDVTFSLAKLLWLRREQPASLDSASHWLAISDWLAWQLTGHMATDLGQASRTSLLDIHHGDWSAEIIERASLSLVQLPELLPLGTSLGQLKPDMAQSLGLDEECSVAVGGYDHVAGILAAGIDGPETMLDNIGTAEALTVVRDVPADTDALTSVGINQGLFELDGLKSYVFAGLPTACAAVSWFQRLHPTRSLLDLTELAHRKRSSAYFLPHLRLGSPPYPDAGPAGAFVGLSDTDDSDSLFFALLDGLALDIACTLELTQSVTGLPAPNRVVAIGGGAHNQLWMRLKAAYFGQPVDILDLPESTAWGAAILAGRAIGCWRADEMPSAPPVAWQAAPLDGIDDTVAAARRTTFANIRQALRGVTRAGV